MSRIAAPAPPYEPEIAASLQKWMPPGIEHDAPLIFRAFHLHPELASRVRPLGAGLLAHGRLPTRDRELVIDRVTARHGAEHEWGLHASVYGPAAELTQQQLASTVNGPRGSPELWSRSDLELFDAVDELSDTTRLGDAAWERLRGRYDDRQLLELIVLVGWYRTIASICNTLELEPEQWTARFPASSDDNRSQA